MLTVETSLDPGLLNVSHLVEFKMIHSVCVCFVFVFSKFFQHFIMKKSKTVGKLKEFYNALTHSSSGKCQEHFIAPASDAFSLSFTS